MEENKLDRQSRVGWDMGVFVDVNANAAYFDPTVDGMGRKDRMFWQA
jgi:hypothetical protein